MHWNRGDLYVLKVVIALKEDINLCIIAKDHSKCDAIWKGNIPKDALVLQQAA
jgi:hypothetical protein